MQLNNDFHCNENPISNIISFLLIDIGHLFNILLLKN